MVLSVHYKAFSDEFDWYFVVDWLKSIHALLDYLVEVLLVQLVDPDQAGVEFKVCDVVLFKLFLDAHRLDFTNTVDF